MLSGIMCLQYLAYSIMLSAFVYPVVVRSIWSKSGFLSAVAADPLWGVGMVSLHRPRAIVF